MRHFKETQNLPDIRGLMNFLAEVSIELLLLRVLGLEFG